MLCEKCKKNVATTHIHTVINGVSKEIHMCSECAVNEGFGSVADGGFDSVLASMFGDSLSLNPPSGQMRCKCCGSTFTDIANTGKAGCPECYETFYNEFLPYIKRVHGSVKHMGKQVNNGTNNANVNNDSIDELKAKLTKLINEEKFEEAAVIRDKIKYLEAKK